MTSREIRLLRALIREQIEEAKTGIYSQEGEEMAAKSSEINSSNIKNTMLALGNAHQSKEIVAIIEKLVTSIQAKGDKQMMAVLPNLRKVQEFVSSGRLTPENPKYFDAITSIGAALLKQHSERMN